VTQPRTPSLSLESQSSNQPKLTADISPLLPTARARHRGGLRPYAADRPLDTYEALFDRVRIKVQGSIEATSDDAVREFGRKIGARDPNDKGRLFGAGQWSGGRLTARVVKGTTLGKGRLVVLASGLDARIDIEASINPMRTLGHLLDRVRLDDFATLAPGDFFAVQPVPTARARSLDGNDNMVSDPTRLGGSFEEERLRANAAYLSVFEDKLRTLLIEALCPRDAGYEYRRDGDDVVADDGATIVRLDWSRLTVSQCEVCWERTKTNAVATVAGLASAVLAGARAASLRHDGLHQERTGGAVTLKVPLIPSGGVELAIYAKDEGRIRLEVRYKNDVPQSVRERVRRSAKGRLSAWFDAFRKDALPRVPWAEMHTIDTISLPLSTEHILDLVEAVDARVGGDQKRRRFILEALLSTGGVTATGPEGLAPAAVLNAIGKDGFIQYVRLIAKDGVIGRRYLLTRTTR
jgi:hypothetical protein